MGRRKRILALFLIAALFLAFVPTSWAGGDEKININTASVEEITKLKNVGPKFAERLIQYRKDHGPFEKPEDIMKVKGIGPKIFELNKERITVE